jgi:hypothetical protein
VNPGCPKIAGRTSDSLGVRPVERCELHGGKAAPKEQRARGPAGPLLSVPSTGLLLNSAALIGDCMQLLQMPGRLPDQGALLLAAWIPPGWAAPRLHMGRWPVSPEVG